MKKIFYIILITITLSGCSFLRPHKMNIEQGNIITQSQVSKLRKGMSEREVKHIMGEPVLINTFSGNRLVYIYTFQKAYGEIQIKKVMLTFNHGRLGEISHTCL